VFLSKAHREARLRGAVECAGPSCPSKLGSDSGDLRRVALEFRLRRSALFEDRSDEYEPAEVEQQLLDLSLPVGHRSPSVVSDIVRRGDEERVSLR
jgi:hypothetical protein